MEFYFAVSLTKTTKKGMINKHKIVDKIRESVEKYNNLFVFSAQSMRNGPLNEVREKWRGTGRYVFIVRLLSVPILQSNLVFPNFFIYFPESN